MREWWTDQYGRIIRGPFDPTTQALEPEIWIKLVEASDYDKLSERCKELEVALEKIADPTSAIGEGRNESYRGWELRKIARDALGKGEWE